jgi:predicted nucleotidyltransferase
VDTRPILDYHRDNSKKVEVPVVLLSQPLLVVTPTLDGDVLTVLALANAAFTPGEVHRILGRHSEDGVRRVLRRLSDQGIVTPERAGKGSVYRLNREHLAAGHIEGLARIRAELVIRIRDHVAGWQVEPDLVAIFGSAARGDMTVDSDIDLLVISAPGQEPDDTWHADLADLTEHVTAWTGNDARILEFTAEEVASAAGTEPVLESARDEGIVVFGQPEYLRQVLSGRS